MRNLTFTAQTIERVKTNWLTKENAKAFVDCKTDSDYCVQFFKIANNQGWELSLAYAIMEEVIEQI